MSLAPTSLQDGLPSSFDLDRHNDTKSAVKAKKDVFPRSWEQFQPAWRAVPLRLFWTKEHNDAFTKSINHAGSAPPWPDRYIQDKEAFAFFVAGFSTIEVTCYAIYTVGSIASPPHFPILVRQDLRRISPESTNERLKEAFPENLLSKTLQAIVTDAVFQKWKRIRNSLIHHCAPSRTIYASVGAPAKDDDLWKHPEFTIKLNNATTNERYAWLLSSLNKLEKALSDFVTEKLK